MGENYVNAKIYLFYLQKLRNHKLSYMMITILWVSIVFIYDYCTSLKTSFCQGFRSDLIRMLIFRWTNLFIICIFVAFSHLYVMLMRNYFLFTKSYEINIIIYSIQIQVQYPELNKYKLFNCAHFYHGRTSLTMSVMQVLYCHL